MDKEKVCGISNANPLYIIELNKEKNEIIVGEENDIYSNELYANDINYIVNIERNKETKVKAKIRYNAKEEEAILKPTNDNTAKLEFIKPIKAITKGQSVVFYIDDVVIGGGKIV